MFEHTKQGAVDLILGNESFDAAQVEKVSGLLDECIGRPQPRVVIDMAWIPRIDSAGLELLLDARKEFQQRGGAVKLAAPNPLCREILRITGVDARLELFDDVASAVRSFAR